METISVKTKNRSEMTDITNEIQRCVTKSKEISGVALVFVPHTTTGVTINENADPDVMRDLLFALERIVPGEGFLHFEGNSNAHVKSLLTGNSVQLIFEDGKLMLGTWQSVFLCEYDGPRQRQVYIKIMGNRTQR